MMKLIHHYTSLSTYKKLGSELLLAVGAITLLLESVSYSFQLNPDITEQFHGFWGILIVSLIISIWRTRPKYSFSIFDSPSNSKVTIKVGDLLEEEGNIAIGINDCLDTEMGRFISPESLQGQFTTNFYSGDSSRFFEVLQQSAKQSGIKPVKDPIKKNGKGWRYPLGTVLVINQEGRHVFPTIYASMSDDGMTETSMYDLWGTLVNLWDKVRISGNRLPISVPVFGTNFGRVKGSLTYSSMVKLIASSYILFARTQPVSKELRLVIHKSDAGKIDMIELENFVNSL